MVVRPFRRDGTRQLLAPACANVGCFLRPFTYRPQRSMLKPACDSAKRTEAALVGWPVNTTPGFARMHVRVCLMGNKQGVFTSVSTLSPARRQRRRPDGACKFEAVTWQRNSYISLPEK